MVRVYLDGQMVSDNYQVSGSVRGIGQLGLAIGHWPNPPNQYTFEGTIFEVIVQKYDPQRDLARGIDPCCFSRDALTRWYQDVTKRGATILAGADALVAATRNAAVALRGGDKAKTLAQIQIATSLAAALDRRDWAALKAILKQAQDTANVNLDAATLSALGTAMSEAITAFNLEWEDWCRFMKLLCIDVCTLEQRR
jgi:hypothetical protein